MTNNSLLKLLSRRALNNSLYRTRTRTHTSTSAGTITRSATAAAAAAAVRYLDDAVKDRIQNIAPSRGPLGIHTARQWQRQRRRWYY